MRFRIHQDSYINGLFVPGYSAAEAGPPVPREHPGPMLDDEIRRRRESEIEVAPAIVKGQFYRRKLANGKHIEVPAEEDIPHVPAGHWEPLDEAAKALCRKHNIEFTGEIPDVLSPLNEKLADMQATISPESTALLAGAVATAVAEALKAAGLGKR